MQVLRIGIALVVMAVWVATYGKYLVSGGVSPPAELSALMLAVVTWALGADVRDAITARRRNDGDGA